MKFTTFFFFNVSENDKMLSQCHSYIQRVNIHTEYKLEQVRFIIMLFIYFWGF